MIGLSALSPDMMFGGGEDELMGGPAFGDILRAVEWQESRGRDDAVSPKGAFGAMQLMPGAVMDYARAHGMPTDPGTIESLRRDPAKNREIGAWYLEQVQGQFGGDIVPALAAYNAGPGRVKQILAGFGGEYSPAIRDEFISRLPAETRGYIASIENRLGQPQPGAPPMPQVPYDEDQGLANISAMGQRVGQMQPAGLSALQPRPQQAQGLSALSPYLEIARQLSPTRESNWGDALVNAGAAMMQSTRPDFLGGLGAGLQAGNQTMMRGREQNRSDTLNQFKLGMELARFDQKDTKPIALAEGGMLVRPDGSVVAENPKERGLKDPIVKEFKEGDKIVTKQWNGAMWKDVGEAPANAPPAGFSRGADGGLVGDEAYLSAQERLRRAGKPETNINMAGETEQSKAYGKEVGQMKAKVLTSAQAQADAAVGMLPAFDQMASALDNGLATGQLASVKDTFARFALELGVPDAVVNQFWNPSDARVFDTAAKGLVLGIIKGLGANPSNADREFIEKTLPNIKDPASAARAIIEHSRSRAQKKIEFYESVYDHADKGGDPVKFEIDWMRRNVGESPWRVREPAPPKATVPEPAPPPAASTPDFPSSLKVTTPDGTGGERTQTVPVQSAPIGSTPTGSIPTFSDPSDPALAAMPPGSVFYAPDGKGGVRLMEKK